jgi:hypothetical protein
MARLGRPLIVLSAMLLLAALPRPAGAAAVSRAAKVVPRRERTSASPLGQSDSVRTRVESAQQRS